jgi:gluconate 2-dehydrogenase gamma chain
MNANNRPRARRPDRRAMLKMMLAAPAMGILANMPARLWAQTLADAQAAPPDGPELGYAQDADAFTPQAFTAQEFAALRALCDCILPADADSGSASDAGVAEFLDDWVDWQRGDLLTQMRFGLAWVDAECMLAFQNRFAACSAEQQTQMLDRIAFPGKATPHDGPAAEFFSQLRMLTLCGYFTSEMGIGALPYVGNEPQSSWQGCPAPALAALGLP